MLHRCLLGLTAFGILSARRLPALQQAPARCDQYVAALRVNPANVDAAASLGRCSVRDYVMIAPDGDSSRLAFRSSWTTAPRALRHAVELAPGDGGAYRPLFHILFAETRDGCSAVTGECRHVSPVLRAGDSVLTVPRPVVLNVPGGDTYDEVVRESQTTRRANLLEARALAERWAAVAPRDRRPHEYLGRALLGLGDFAAASAALDHAASLGTADSRRALFWDRMEALVKSDRGEAARRLLDEAASDPARDSIRLNAYAVAHLDALLGRRRPPPPDTSARARAQRARLDSIVRTRPPESTRPPSFSELLASGDTSAARSELARTDAIRAMADGTWHRVNSAAEHLALGDTLGAEARLSEIEQMFNDRSFQRSANRADPEVGRAWLLTGDVAAARGRREEAGRMYRRVIGLWGGGDADLQPVVDAARSKLAALSTHR